MIMDKRLDKNLVLGAWVAALRGGTYQQVQGVLRNDQGFCCLGVLCDVIDPTEWDICTTTPIYYGYKKNYKNLPWDIKSDLGLGPCDNFPESFHSKLTTMNDNENADFNQIADYIEQVIIPTVTK